MDNQYIIGLDVGTSVTKAALFDRAGRELAATSRRTAVLSPHAGWYEMEPDELFDAACAACRELMSKVGIAPEAVAALAISGVMIGGWLVSADQQVVRPGILWNDGRAQELVDQLVAANPSLMSQLFDSSGQVMQLGCTLPVLAWLAENEPLSVARASVILTAKDFIRMRLTGTVATDETDAAIAPGSAARRAFNPELLQLFGIERHAHLLPPVRRSSELAGVLSVEAAHATGLAPGTPVAIGAGDLPACVLGAGAAAPGIACSVVGTTCLNGVVSDAPVFNPRDMGILFTVPGDLWIKTMVNVAGTTNLDWSLSALCPDLLGRPDAYEQLASLAAGSPAGAGGVCYVPYLSHIGIIAPRLEAGARAGFVGLNPSHGRGDLIRAVYEGLAYAIRDCYDRIEQPISAIRLVGGAARSPFWTQMIADVTGVPVEVPEGSEFGAKGAALLAAVAIGWYGDIRQACRETFSLSRRHDPDPALSAAYDAGCRRYQIACEAMLDRLAPVYRG
ncbi:carbohydrate kinase [Mesorhizobium sp. YC-39]|uniref:FGGY-family carbohydrate kinase n=1 Tax=unclassified Mesorhizobium TaxID=325217 RepID=UPI0021E92CEF|nr:MULTISPECIES: FGGY-family carbohydrate kinase [unclassified Mesorhizobium]MCV3210813.1 carbohydrate kinase [Mesorhizobium sp. YC-2]MCV3231047.1 carbohydrate kinase [Mesorhizobium sp. YC-39]